MSTPRPPGTQALALVDGYRNFAEALKQFRETKFKIGERVSVDAGRYRGPGIVASDSSCPPDQLPVRLENGNVWWYPIECCWQDLNQCSHCLKSDRECE